MREKILPNGAIIRDNLTVADEEVLSRLDPRAGGAPLSPRVRSGDTNVNVTVSEQDPVVPADPHPE